jgi:DNA modification methylase
MLKSSKTPEEKFPYQVQEPICYYKSSESMKELKDESVGLIVTSPPYGQIKDYGVEAQIGHEEDFDTYFKRLKSVWQECHRVLSPQRRMIINIGDQYLRAKDYGRYRIVSISAQIIQDCQALGFDYMGDIIWQKISTTNTTGGCSFMGSLFYPPNGLPTYDYEHILIFKKVQGTEIKTDRTVKELSKISMDEWKDFFIGHWKILGTTQDVHMAMFPEEIPYRLIRMFSYIGETVLDPFCGSGTVLRIAKVLFRKGIGYEINPEFQPIIANKIKIPTIGNILKDLTLNPTEINTDALAMLFPDYFSFIYLIFNLQDIGRYEIDYEFMKQKSIIAIKNTQGQVFIIDFINLTKKDFESDRYLTKMKAKMQENNIINFLQKSEKWSEIRRFFLFLAYPEIYNKEVDLFIGDCPNPDFIIMNFWNFMRNHTIFLSELK